MMATGRTGSPAQTHRRIIDLRTQRPGVPRFPPPLGTAFGPNFFIVGAAKAGTTRLAELLSRHPDVAIPVKEPMFFRSDEEFEARQSHFERMYSDVSVVPARGDASASYSARLMHPGVPARIRRVQPDARVIYLVRHPVRRIEAAWLQMQASGMARRHETFESVLLDRPEWLIDPSMYWEQLQAYRAVFPDEQIRVLIFEEFIADETAAVTELINFLGLPSHEIRADDRHGQNASANLSRHQYVDPGVADLSASGLRARVDAARARVAARLAGDLRSPRWTTDLLISVRAQLEPDAAALLDFLGRPPGYWSLAREEVAG